LFSPELTQYAIMLLSALAVGGVVYAVALPFFNGERRASKRVANLASERTPESARNNPEQKRRRAVQKVLDELDETQRKKTKMTMTRWLSQTGMAITPTTFYIGSMISGVVVGVGALLASGKPIVAAVALFVGAFGLPRWFINRAARKRQKKFIDEFANAIDIVVRGVKSGLPLNDCIKIIAAESPDPVGTEFARIVEEQRVGVPLAIGIERLYQRIPLQEVNFLGIVISIQQTAGGNLAEALGNLSAVLRERKKLENKVKAFSAEAKASAAIIGSLPMFVGGLVYLMRPEYVGILFSDKTGNLLLIVSAIWMTIGVLIMRKMINFDF
jgi:tight adherence protein B